MCIQNKQTQVLCSSGSTLQLIATGCCECLNFILAQKWLDTSKTKLKGGQLNATGHWRLVEHSKQALLLHWSPGSRLWATGETQQSGKGVLVSSQKKEIRRAKFSFLMREVKQKFSFWQAYDRESHLTTEQSPKGAPCFIRAVTGWGEIPCCGWGSPGGKYSLWKPEEEFLSIRVTSPCIADVIKEIQ